MSSSICSLLTATELLSGFFGVVLLGALAADAGDVRVGADFVAATGVRLVPAEDIGFLAATVKIKMTC